MDYYTKEEIDKLLEENIAKAVEQALRSLPFVVQSLMATTAQMQEKRENFYKDNKDLVGKETMVAKVMERVESENAGDNFDEILSKTSRLTRELITSGGNLDTAPISKPSKDKIHDGLAKIMEGM